MSLGRFALKYEDATTDGWCPAGKVVVGRFKHQSMHWWGTWWEATNTQICLSLWSCNSCKSPNVFVLQVRDELVPPWPWNRWFYYYEHIRPVASLMGIPIFAAIANLWGKNKKWFLGDPALRAGITSTASWHLQFHHVCPRTHTQTILLIFFFFTNLPGSSLNQPPLDSMKTL